MFCGVPVDMVWDSSDEKRPGSAEGSPVYVYPVKYSGESWESKVKRVKAQMESEKAQLLVVSELDEIAWLFNLRFCIYQIFAKMKHEVIRK